MVYESSMFKHDRAFDWALLGLIDIPFNWNGVVGTAHENMEILYSRMRILHFIWGRENRKKNLQKIM